MHYETLGRSGLQVSRLCLGAMMFGERTEEADSLDIVARARDAGVNFIDIADVYAGGRSEEIAGKAVGRNRDDWIVATKLGGGPADPPNRQGLSRLRVFAAADASLKRLGLDHIDIYYLHREDPATDLAETVRAMGDLIDTGKVRYWGVSNHRTWKLAEICNIADRLGVPRPIVSQPRYNALNRMPEEEHLPAASYYGLGVVPYSPLARGVLTAKYVPGAPPPPDTRAGRSDTRMMQSEWREESLGIARKIGEYAEGRGTTAIRFAIAWVLANRFVAATIIGPRTMEHLEAALGAEEFDFTPEDDAFVEALVPRGHPSTPGYVDPAFPIEGRVLR